MSVVAVVVICAAVLVGCVVLLLWPDGAPKPMTVAEAQHMADVAIVVEVHRAGLQGTVRLVETEARLAEYYAAERAADRAAGLNLGSVNGCEI